MNNDRIRLAQFGVGRWGNHLLRNFLSLSTVNVAAVVEPNANRHSMIRNQFELADTVDLATDGTTVLARTDIDAIVIATPAATHYALVKAALKAHKHVLVEKPLTLSIQECHELCALAAEHDRQLIVDHTYLFHPVVAQGQSLLSTKALGNVHYGYATRTNLGPVRSDVDAMWDLAIHDIAIFNHWLGETPALVSAQGQTWLQPNRALSSQLSHGSQGIADVVWIQLQYPSGFQATLHVSWANPDKQRRLGVVGDRGTLIFDEMQPQPLVLQWGALEVEGDRFCPNGLQRESIPIPQQEPLAEVCQHFIQCIQQQNVSSQSSGRVGTELVRVLTALTHSLNNGGCAIAVAEFAT
ncbi:Gfo/Idh/MocA family oxidoreductase [Oscillatoria sp. CS-180]|uniref:Gfo/Idh/MocA family protein n=1 Tax=Oscillatoria sp. CS-180 TaxID=3021720 RepID=UPI00232B6573|nr:Gfo/Idh/MocA family oxidoreductase [Oscillatoria sp. CS-180]MDB9524999.1 Gfo/Idh/MocA family oxidoreductase [Oscillatoria sp. CS-180]